jgi:hypothetical protein
MFQFSSCTHLEGGWVGPRAYLDDNEKIYRDYNSEYSVFQPIASRFTDFAILSPDGIRLKIWINFKSFSWDIYRKRQKESAHRM